MTIAKPKTALLFFIVLSGAFSNSSDAKRTATRSGSSQSRHVIRTLEGSPHKTNIEISGRNPLGRRLDKKTEIVTTAEVVRLVKLRRRMLLDHGHEMLKGRGGGDLGLEQRRKLESALMQISPKSRMEGLAAYLMAEGQEVFVHRAKPGISAKLETLKNITDTLVSENKLDSESAEGAKEHMNMLAKVDEAVSVDIISIPNTNENRALVAAVLGPNTISKPVEPRLSLDALLEKRKDNQGPTDYLTISVKDFDGPLQLGAQPSVNSKTGFKR